MRPISRSWLALTAAAALMSLAPNSFAGNPQDVANFSDGQYTGSTFGQITGLSWGSRGGVNYLFVCNRAGAIYVIRNGTTQGPLTNVSPIWTGDSEVGLESVMTDVDFGGANPYVWIYVTETDGIDGPPRVAGNARVHRYTFADNAGTVSLSSKTAVGPVMPTHGVNHNGGGIAQDSSGRIYAGVGNCNNGINEGGNGQANELTSLGSKVVRFNRDGTAAGGSNYITSANATTKYIFARGFRNPFGLRIRPGGSNQLWMFQVGDGWEQIFHVTENSNQGWPTENNTSTTNGLLIPKYAYNTGGSIGNCLTRAAFYNGTAYPAAYQGNIFFCEYGSSRIYRAQMSGDNITSSSVAAFVTNASNPTDIAVGPDGALYYGSSGNGQVRRVSYTGSTAPTITAAPQSRTVTEGQTAQFTVTATPAGVTYQWQVMPPGGSFANVTNGTGGTTATYTTPATTVGMSGTQYRVIVTNGGLSTTSSAATLTVNGPAAAIPVISPGGGTYTGPVTVRLTTATAGATIRHTTNNTAPTGSSTAYTAPFVVSANSTVRAITTMAGMTNSAEASAVFTITGSTPYGIPYRETVTGLNIPTVAAGLPATLSATGLFQSPVSSMTPKAGLIPFGINAPLWSDDARKKRWIALPGNSKITFNATGEWTFPVGTILVKHFDLPINDTNPGLTKRLETRVFYIDQAGGTSYGATYKWRADNSEADLLTNATTAQDEIQTITTSTGTRNQTWSYPSRDNCLNCHNPAAGVVLGPKTRQLNGTYAYPSGTTDNQLRTWNYLQMFTTTLNEATIATYAKLNAVDDVAANLEQRSRSYFDSNCANCHRPGAPMGRAQWDGRYTTALGSTGIIEGTVYADNPLGLADPKIVAGADPANSMLLQRMMTTTNARMPQIASHVVDDEAVITITAWINTLPAGGSNPTPAPTASKSSSGGCGLTGLEGFLILAFAACLRARRH